MHFLDMQDKVFPVEDYPPVRLSEEQQGVDMSLSPDNALQDTVTMWKIVHQSDQLDLRVSNLLDHQNQLLCLLHLSMKAV